MKFSLATVLVGLLPLAMARSIIVTYPQGTPKGVVDNGKQSVKDAGGQITNEYPLIRGFSAEAPEDAIQCLDELSPKYQPVVENDQQVSAVGAQETPKVQVQ